MSIPHILMSKQIEIVNKHIFISTSTISLKLNELNSTKQWSFSLDIGELIYHPDEEEVKQNKMKNIVSVSSEKYNADKAISYKQHIIFLLTVPQPIKLMLLVKDKHYVLDENYECQNYTMYMNSIVKILILPMEDIKGNLRCEYTINVPGKISGEFTINN